VRGVGACRHTSLRAVNDLGCQNHPCDPVELPCGVLYLVHTRALCDHGGDS
jgi:hypothetical protein